MAGLDIIIRMEPPEGTLVPEALCENVNGNL